MKFRPYHDKIEIKPFKKENIILNENESLIEKGEVIACGLDATWFKPGDIVYFDSWGCSKTPDGEHYVVSISNNVILGKDEQ